MSAVVGAELRDDVLTAIAVGIAVGALAAERPCVALRTRQVGDTGRVVRAGGAPLDCGS